MEHIAVDTLWSIVLLAALCTGLLQTSGFKARGVGPCMDKYCGAAARSQASAAVRAAARELKADEGLYP